MTRKRIIQIGIIAAMLVIAGILALGDFGKDTGALNKAQVTTVTASVQTNGIVLVVSGTRPECDTISDWQQKRQRDLISVTPVFQRLSDVSCDTVVPLEETVAVDVGDLIAGIYRIDVLGATTTVVLDRAIAAFSFEKFSDASFNNFPIDVVADVTKADLDTASLTEFGSTADVQNKWKSAVITAADRLTTIAVSCGQNCYKHAVIDMQTGKLVQTFTSQYGIIVQPGSKLLIVNDPRAIIASGTKDAVVAEAYVFNPNTRTFEFIAQGDYLLGELHTNQ